MCYCGALAGESGLCPEHFGEGDWFADAINTVATWNNEFTTSLWYSLQEGLVTLSEAEDGITWALYA